jgi:hypothetical protein
MSCGGVLPVRWKSACQRGIVRAGKTGVVKLLRFGGESRAKQCMPNLGKHAGDNIAYSKVMRLDSLIFFGAFDHQSFGDLLFAHIDVVRLRLFGFQHTQEKNRRTTTRQMAMES